jgi:hypothetical protein
VKRRGNDRAGRHQGPLMMESDLARLHLQRRDPSEAKPFSEGSPGDRTLSSGTVTLRRLTWLQR